MGFTAILRVTNESTSMAQLRDHENEGDTAGEKGNIRPCAVNHKFNGAFGMYIPWTTSEADFRWGHRIMVVLIDPQGVPWKSFAIWQRDTGNNDKVRCSSPADWQDPGDEIGGVAEVAYDRRLIIEDNDELSLERLTAPRRARGKGTLEFGAAAQNGAGHAFI